MANLSAQIERLRKEVQRVIAEEHGRITYEEACICFPQPKEPIKGGVARLIFGCSEHLELAWSILCPLHGRRFDPHNVMMFYESEWLREGLWESQWVDFDSQMRKAMQATFKTRESYGLPNTSDSTSADGKAASTFAVGRGREDLNLRSPGPELDSKPC